MAKKFDKIVVLDIEATCWATEAERGDQESEIIELGLCNYHVETGHISEAMSIYVRPDNIELSQFCTDLTGITTGQLKKEGVPLEGAVNRLRKHFGPKHRVMAQWGNYDWYQVSTECLRKDINFPFGRSNINVKELYAVYRKLPKALGLGNALKNEKMEFIGQPHSGRDDAYNTARILKLVLEGA